MDLACPTGSFRRKIVRTAKVPLARKLEIDFFRRRKEARLAERGGGHVAARAERFVSIQTAARDAVPFGPYVHIGQRRLLELKACRGPRRRHRFPGVSRPARKIGPPLSRSAPDGLRAGPPCY